MGLTTAASGLTAAKKTLDVCSQNMANLQTNTYKRRFTIQADHAYHQLQGAGTPTSAEGTINPMGSYIGMGVQTIAVSPAMEQGQIEITDNPLDVAIDGLGFFEVELPNGETGFTRDGQFSLNNERMLVTAKGYKLKPEITIPVNTESYEITNEGQVYAKIQGCICQP
jgi:flagellar basal-body rod protein FlgG